MGPVVAPNVSRTLLETTERTLDVTINGSGQRAPVVGERPAGMTGAVAR